MTMTYGFGSRCLTLLALVVTSTAAAHETTLAHNNLRPSQGRMLQDCPSVTPLSADEFDVNSYTEKSWFIQKQQINPYQSENNLYCVVATYFAKDGYIQVINTANTGGVDGPAQAPVNPDSDQLCAEQIEGGSLQVAPCFFRSIFLFSLLAGPYWVLAVDENYEWAIVSGGQPDEFKETVDGVTYCTTRETGCINGAGLWLFSRSSEYNQTQIDIQEAKLTELGFYTKDLLQVTHDGCTYPTFIKT
jgi:lipocalin